MTKFWHQPKHAIRNHWLRERGLQRDGECVNVKRCNKQLIICGGFLYSRTERDTASVLRQSRHADTAVVYIFLLRFTSSKYLLFICSADLCVLTASQLRAVQTTSHTTAHSSMLEENRSDKVLDALNWQPQMKISQVGGPETSAYFSSSPCEPQSNAVWRAGVVLLSGTG